MEVDEKEFQKLVDERAFLQRRVTELQTRGNELLFAHRSRAYGGILTGNEIDREISLGEISVTPYERSQINPASLDLRLGGKIAVYAERFLDCKVEQPVSVVETPVGGPIGLQPGELYLMHTVERISTKRYAPVLDGKSSLGRLGIKIHETAGYGDPGYDGQYTLEVTVVKPTRVYVGMRFCQIRFHTLVGELTDYAASGSYQGDFAEGPVPSRCYKQFK